MKKFLLISVFILLLSACSSVNVNSDYDKKVDFSQFKTYAFYKSGIDKVEISDLDKKRILESLGLRKIGQVVEHDATPNILGMVAKVSHLVSVEEA